jgi:hypothetical protein
MNRHPEPCPADCTCGSPAAERARRLDALRNQLIRRERAAARIRALAALRPAAR